MIMDEREKLATNLDIANEQIDYLRAHYKRALARIHFLEDILIEIELRSRKDGDMADQAINKLAEEALTSPRNL